jgi:hypothetical protein
MFLHCTAYKVNSNNGIELNSSPYFSKLNYESLLIKLCFGACALRFPWDIFVKQPKGRMLVCLSRVAPAQTQLETTAVEENITLSSSGKGIPAFEFNWCTELSVEYIERKDIIIDKIHFLLYVGGSLLRSEPRLESGRDKTLE